MTDNVMLGKDMEWPICNRSIDPENVWNKELHRFMVALDEVRNEPWWICDTDLKYLNIRIDTRDNGFWLTIDGKGNNNKIRIDPQRVIRAIEEYKTKYGIKSYV